MAIRLNPLNTQGLAAYAGNRIGNLGLDFRRDRSGEKLAMQREQMKQQGNLAERKMQMQERGMDQQQLMQMEKMKMQKEAATERKAMFQHKMELAAKEEASKNDEDTIKKKSAAAQMFLLSPELAKDDKKTKTFVNHLVKNGVYTKEEADEFVAMEPNDRLTAAKAQIAVSGNALQFKKTMPQAQAGGTTVTLPDGTVVKSQPATKSTISATQKDLVTMRKDMASLQLVKKNMFEDALTWRGKIDAEAAVIAEKAKGLPGVEQIAEGMAKGLTGKNREERSKMIKQFTTFINGTEQFFQKNRKRITGAQAALAELAELRKRILSGDMSVSEFQGAIDTILAQAGADIKILEETLGQGVKVDEKKPVKPEASGYSEEDITHTMKIHNLSREEVMRRLKGRK